METCRVPFVYDADAVSADNSLTCPEVSLTRQEFKDESDINVLIEKFGVLGELPPIGPLPVNADFTGVGDFHDAMNGIVAAERTFMSVPAKVRALFENNAGLFVDFCSDPNNGDELVRLGLAEIRPEPQPSDTDRIIAALKPPAQLPT